MPVEFPAVADIDVVNALRDGARETGIPYHLGISQSKDSFFGEVDPDRMPVAGRLHERWKAWVAGGAVCSEMESAAIFIIASIQRKRAGGVMLLIGDPTEKPRNTHEAEALEALRSEDRVIKTAIAGLKILIERDRNTPH